MGFYYFMLLFIGIIMTMGGFLLKRRNWIGRVLISFFGLLAIGLSIFLFQPESSDVIAELIGWE
ncbi:hypothetical protein ACFOZY_10065 [Chungangia koreensis]|uniref:Uncharacterized protein n=1 Tax=Chungangia koreensis TaxID=752657 RepID=A0ABV8X6J3_9LACT